MNKMYTQKDSINKWFGDVGPRVQQILDKAIFDSGSCLAFYARDMQYQVQHAFGSQFTVNLK